MKSHRILVAPLDWGLGHAARCIPIVSMLTENGFQVVIAADKRPYDLLKKEFPSLTFVRFPGHSVAYSADGSMTSAIIKQLPEILQGIRSEERFLNTLIDRHSIDAVISDSRFGVVTKRVPSILLIHQLRILLSPGLRWGEGLLSTIVRRRINKFSECWVPDSAGADNLSGRLSHNITLPLRTYFLGPISRLTPEPPSKKEFDILIILSGPEPQRTIFEDTIVEQLKKTSLRAFIVRGIPERSMRVKLSDTITAVSALTGKELSKAISVSDIIISRPGYSTLMDLSFVGANAIFVPTPQQTEQEFLANELKRKGICYSETQKTFTLERALSASKNYRGLSVVHNDMTVLRERIDHLRQEIERRK